VNRPAGPGIDDRVFWITVTISVAFVLWGVVATESLASVASTALDYVISTFG
jgi:glycine betaine transporter